MKFNEKRPLYQLMELAAFLRGQNGCAWDKAQTSKTLKSYLIEEAYEVFDAIENDDPDNFKEELGDLLYQIYAHAQIANEKMYFNIDDVAKNIIDKLVQRHPHVFGNEKLEDKDKVIEKWEKIKLKEKSNKESILEGVPKHLPALLKAYRVQQKVSRVGFDWDRIENVCHKLDEEIGEFKEAISSKVKEKIYEEIGDVLFTIVNISRFIEVNPEEALLKTIDKFMSRFRFVEEEIAKNNKKIEDMSLEELDMMWNKSKK